MPERGKDSGEGLLRRVSRYVWDASMAFSTDNVPGTAAAMAYFLLLAIAPLVLLVNVAVAWLTQLTGQQVGATAVAAASGTAAQYYQQAAAWAGGYAPWVIGALVLVGAASVFVQFVDAVNGIWKTAPANVGARTYVRHRGVALALLGVAAGAIVVAVIVAAIVGIVATVGLSYVQSLGIDVSGWWSSHLGRALVVLVASALLFAFGFVLAPDRHIRWLDALPSAIVTAVLFLVGEQVLSIYLGNTERFAVFGTSQFFVVLTVWIYYSAMVVLWGVELSRVTILDAEASRGELAEEPNTQA